MLISVPFTNLGHNTQFSREPHTYEESTLQSYSTFKNINFSDIKMIFLSKYQYYFIIIIIIIILYSLKNHKFPGYH